MSVFFFQAEDGIRDYKVTGVQTCALPISTSGRTPFLSRKRSAMASLTRSAAKLRLVSGLCWAVTSILKLSRGENQISQATSLAARYRSFSLRYRVCDSCTSTRWASRRSEEHTSELQSPCNLVCRLLLEKKT